MVRGKELCLGQDVPNLKVFKNDADRNSRTCFAARSARRDDCRRDVGRDRAKKAAKMNVERAPCLRSRFLRRQNESDWSWADPDEIARICVAEGMVPRQQYLRAIYIIKKQHFSSR